MSSVKSINISRSEFEKVCKQYTAYLKSIEEKKISNTKNPPQGCPSQFVSGAFEYVWNNGRPYRVSTRRNFGFQDIEINQNRRYYVSEAGFKKACSTSSNTNNRRLVSFKPIRI
jgi:hypothetical protein